MNARIRGGVLFALVVAAVLHLSAGQARTQPPAGSKAYVSNTDDGTVTVVDLVTMGAIGAPLATGSEPRGSFVTPSGAFVYVANRFSDTVSMIDTSTDSVVTSIPVTCSEPYNLEITPDGSKVYVVCKASGTVSVISTASNTEIASIPLPGGNPSPEGIAITPDGSKVYVVNRQEESVDVIATATNAVIAGPIPVGSAPRDAHVTPDGSKVIVVGEGAPVIILVATDTPSSTIFADIGTQRDVDIAGNQAYVTNFFGPPGPSLDIYNLATESYVGSIMLGGDKPYGVVVSPDGSRAWVTFQDSDEIREVDLGSMAETGRSLAVGSAPRGISGLFPAAETAGLDHFLFYTTKVVRGSPKFQSKTVTLTDQFETGEFVVKKPVRLANPVDKNEEGVFDSDTHLRSYRITPKTKHVIQTGIKVTNQFHSEGSELTVNTVKADRLLVPTAKSLTGPVDPPDPSLHNVDHYKCYRVRRTRGAAKFPKGLQATVADQFNDATVYNLKKPLWLCTPTDKDEETTKNPDSNLMCYKVKRARGEPKNNRISGIHVNNQFGAAELKANQAKDLCVPSTITIAGGSSPLDALDPGEEFEEVDSEDAKDEADVKDEED